MRNASDSEVLHWIRRNLLTDSQLDVKLPDGRTIRFIGEEPYYRIDATDKDGTRTIQTTTTLGKAKAEAERYYRTGRYSAVVAVVMPEYRAVHVCGSEVW